MDTGNFSHDSEYELTEYPNDYGCPEGWYLQLTCGACPEQYDLKDDKGDMRAYFRLRHGYFRVEVPDCGGEIVYDAEPEGDGIFEDEERPKFMTEGMDAVKKHYGIPHLHSKEGI